MRAIRAHSYLLGIMFSFETFITRTSIFINLVTFIYLGNDITAEKVFAVTAIYNVMRPIITMIFTISISSIAEVNISVNRINKFLSYEELRNPNEKILDNYPIKGSLINGLSIDKSEKKGSEEACVRLEKVSAKWLTESKENTLEEIDLTVSGDKIVAVIGPVGSGKSSILNVILKELPVCSGNLEVVGKISFSSQEPWLFNGSVRQNILFGDQFDESRYMHVVKVCALESDLTILPYGDKTMVGEKGKSLSGGQKARVNLARCVYKEADIYLLDDPLSAVDAKVGKQLFEECVVKYLKGKIRILITHQLQYLKSADHILIIKDGEIQKQGTYTDLQTSGLDFAKLLEEFHSPEEEENERKIKLRQMSETAEIEDDIEDPEMDREHMETGKVKFDVYKAYLRFGGSWFTIFAVVLLFVFCQASGNGIDYFVSFWVNMEQDMANNNKTEPILSRQNVIYTYAGLVVLLIIFAVWHCIYYFVFLMKASIKIHDVIFSNVADAVMRFFNKNPSGRILNRFSKDLGIIDEYIPLVLFDVIEVCNFINKHSVI